LYGSPWHSQQLQGVLVCFKKWSFAAGAAPGSPSGMRAAFHHLMRRW
jgi:hypothetical protein